MGKSAGFWADAGVPNESIIVTMASAMASVMRRCIQPPPSPGRSRRVVARIQSPIHRGRNMSSDLRAISSLDVAALDVRIDDDRRRLRVIDAGRRHLGASTTFVVALLRADLAQR